MKWLVEWGAPSDLDVRISKGAENCAAQKRKEAAKQAAHTLTEKKKGSHKEGSSGARVHCQGTSIVRIAQVTFIRDRGGRTFRAMRQ